MAVIFITGASSGLGLAISERFLRDGHCVVMGARRVEAMQAFTDTRPHFKDRVMCVSCDVTDRESVISAVALGRARFGRIDIALANAGVGYPSSAEALDIGVYRTIFETNVFGALYLFEAVLPEMIHRRSGQLVGISSLASYRGLRGAGAYCGSKSALSAIMESFRLDLGDIGISSTLICPGFIKTPLTDRNQYHMPFLMSLDHGVDHIYRAILDKKKVYSFPWPLAILVRIGRLFPAWLYDFFMAKRKNLKTL